MERFRLTNTLKAGGFKTFRMANHSQDERLRRVRLCQRGELPLPFRFLWFWLCFFFSFLFFCSDAGELEGSTVWRCSQTRVQAWCFVVIFPAAQSHYFLTWETRAGAACHFMLSKVLRGNRSSSENFNDLHRSGSSRMNILNQISQIKPYEPNHQRCLWALCLLHRVLKVSSPSSGILWLPFFPCCFKCSTTCPVGQIKKNKKW